MCRQRLASQRRVTRLPISRVLNKCQRRKTWTQQIQFRNTLNYKHFFFSISTAMPQEKMENDFATFWKGLWKLSSSNNLPYWNTNFLFLTLTYTMLKYTRVAYLMYRVHCCRNANYRYNVVSVNISIFCLQTLTESGWGCFLCACVLWSVSGYISQLDVYSRESRQHFVSGTFFSRGCIFSWVLPT